MKIQVLLLALACLLAVVSSKYSPSPPPPPGCKGAGAKYPDGDLEGCAGIQVVHAGSFYPYEYVNVDGIIDGVSPRYIRMLSSKGYLRAAKCPYGHIDDVHKPLFGDVITSVTVAGVTLPMAGGALDVSADMACDWGNTTARRRFYCPTSAFIASPDFVIVCDNSGSTPCIPTDQWNGNQVNLEPVGFVNGFDCLAAAVGANKFETQLIVVANDLEIIDNVQANPGTYGLVGKQDAEARQLLSNSLVILSNQIKCSPGWGCLTKKDDEDLCHCITKANQLVDPLDYAEVCCSFRTAFEVDQFGPQTGEDHFNKCIADRSVVDDQGGPELFITYQQCGNHFCQVPGDAACY